MTSNAAGRVGARFVSETEIEAARNSSGADSEYDPRSLYERLQAHKEAKDSANEEKYKLSNQFRGIDEGESDFLAQVAGEQRREREERERREREELEAFRKAKAGASTVSDKAELKVAKKDEPPALPDTTTSVSKKKRKASSGLLGVVKKKPSSTATRSATTASSQPTTKSASSTATDAATKSTSTASHQSSPAKPDPPQTGSKTT